MDENVVPGALVVSLGILTQAEFGAVSWAEQSILEAETRRLFASYGSAWVSRERNRLRQELELAWGVKLETQEGGSR